MINFCTYFSISDYADILKAKISVVYKQQIKINKRLSEIEQCMDQLTESKSHAQEIEAKLISYLPLLPRNVDLFEQKLRKERNALALVKLLIFVQHI